jgi:hypothetical protein
MSSGRRAVKNKPPPPSGCGSKATLTPASLRVSGRQLAPARPAERNPDETCQASYRPGAVRRSGGQASLPSCRAPSFTLGAPRSASRRQLYILGLNPGGSPRLQAEETVGKNLEDWRALPESFGPSYADESWEGRAPGDRRHAAAHSPHAQPDSRFESTAKSQRAMSCLSVPPPKPRFN